MKQLLKHALFCVCLLGGAAVATSCSDNKDLFDQEEWNKMMEKSFPVSDIQTDWQTVGTATANVSVYKDAGETYTVKLYDSDPLVGTSAVLLAKGSVATGSTFSTKFDYALADSVIYVACIDSKFRREVIPVHNVTDGSSFNVTFGGNSVASKSLSSRAAVSITDPEVAAKVDCPYTTSDINNLLNGATEISSLKKDWSGGVNIAPWVTDNKKIFKITDKFSGDVSNDAPLEGTIIVVTGTWTPNSTSFKDNLQVIVANGGKIVLNYDAMTSNRSSGYGFVVMPGGEISGTGSLKYVNPAPLFYNGGTINLKSMTSSSGGTYYNAAGGNLTLSGSLLLNTGTNLVNYGTVAITGSISMPANGVLYNANSMTGGDLAMQTMSTLYNHGTTCHFTNITGDSDNRNVQTSCKLVIDGAFTPSNVVIADGGSIECNSMTLHSSTIKMGEASILKAASTTLQKVTVTGPTTGNYAICDLGDVTFGYDKVNYQNHVYVDMKTAPTGDDYKKNLSTTGGASIVGHGEASETIPAGDCSCGYNSNSGHEVVDPVSFTTTYCFEDNYPYAGDYDFNDAVFAIGKTVSGSTVTLAVKLKAVGASRKLGAAIRLAGITSGITSVSLDNGFSGESTGYQQGNGGVVIPILSDAHYALAQTTDRGFINTIKGGKTAEAKVLNITIQCASESVANSINSDNIDLYITNDDYEIHTYQWRDNAALGRVASELETGKYVWAIAVPYEFRYPQEYQVITGAYSKFEKWAHSPQDNSKWYKKYDESLVY